MEKLNRYLSFELLFALLFIIAFFLPWVDMGLLKIIGWDIPSWKKTITKFSNFVSRNKTSIYQAYIVYLIPVFSILVMTLWVTLKQKMARILLACTGIFTFALSIYLYFSVPKAGSGIYLLFVSSLLSIIYLYFIFRKKKATIEQAQ